VAYLTVQLGIAMPFNLAVCESVLGGISGMI
jgi:hypothetical protein